MLEERALPSCVNVNRVEVKVPLRSGNHDLRRGAVKNDEEKEKR